MPPTPPVGTTNQDSNPDGLDGWGYDPLDNLLELKHAYTRDACILHLKLQCADPSQFEIKYVFGSDDYPSTGFEGQEDLMAAFLNGLNSYHNLATISGDYVSVNTIHNGNSLLHDNQYGAFPTELNGFTKELTAKGTSNAGTNRIYIAVADGGIRDCETNGAWVFIEANSMKYPAAGDPPGPTPAKDTPKKCANKSVEVLRVRQSAMRRQSNVHYLQSSIAEGCSNCDDGNK